MIFQLNQREFIDTSKPIDLSIELKVQEQSLKAWGQDDPKIEPVRDDNFIGSDRDNLIKQLREHGIDSRPVFPAISQYPIWGNNSEPRVNSLLVSNTGINLPSGVCLKKHEIQYIADTIRKILS